MMIHDKGIFTISNILTIARAPMAIFFLVENSMVRLIIVAVAMITDGIDGYIARRYNMESQVGRFLDPIMDKFFVFFVLAVLVSEGRLVSWNLFAMVFRDACLCAFGAYVSIFGTLQLMYRDMAQQGDDSVSVCYNNRPFSGIYLPGVSLYLLHGPWPSFSWGAVSLL